MYQKWGHSPSARISLFKPIYMGDHGGYCTQGIVLTCNFNPSGLQGIQSIYLKIVVISFALYNLAGYYSWRNNVDGSWFIQAINKVFKEHSKDKDLMWMMTRVSNMVAMQFESSANKKKQIPSIVTQLTKDVFFYPKK